jgi:hypothetical protein
MSRNIDFDKPLSAEDRAWLHEWSMDWRIEENDRKFSDLVQNNNGPQIQNDPNNGTQAPRSPHQFPGEKVATGPVYPVSTNSGSVQEYADTAPKELSAAAPSGEQVAIEDLTDAELDAELKGLKESTIGTRKQKEDRLIKALEAD